METKLWRQKVKISLLIVAMMFVVFSCITEIVQANDNIWGCNKPIATEPTPTIVTEPLIDTPISYPDFQYTKPSTKQQAIRYKQNTFSAIQMLEVACQSDNYTVEALSSMRQELERLRANAEKYEEDIKRFEQRETDYYYATTVWNFLKELGYSDVACAGIMGNLMAECGGHTLNLDPFLYDAATGNYYGMFQWSTYYYPDVEGASFEEQLQYFKETVGPIFKTWGKNYAEGFTLEDFNNLTDPRDAALAFAKVYERCADWTYERRQDFSIIAYNYFVLGE
jgi:hypothetical protein